MAYNILFISHERKMGGANHSLLELTEGLRSLGNNIYVVVLYRGCPIDIKLRKMGIETFPCFFGWWQQPKNWPFFIKVLFRILHWLQRLSVICIAHYVKKRHIDVIHSNSSVIDIGAQVAERTGCKHVWHIREYGDADYGLEYIYGREISIRYILKHSDMIIFISNALRKSYEQFEGNQEVQVIYDGIVSENPEKENANQKKIDRKEGDYSFTFLVTGNISEGKNQKLVVEAADILVHQMNINKSKFKVLFAGAATSLAESKKYMHELQTFIHMRNLDNLIFVGYVEDMNKLRRYVEVEIVPSKSEAYGRVTLEAMLNQNLVIAANSGANPELLGENLRGLLFESNNSMDLAMKMLQAMDNDYTEYTDRALEYVKKVHIREESYNKVQSVYQYILEKGKDFSCE